MPIASSPRSPRANASAVAAAAPAAATAARAGSSIAAPASVSATWARVRVNSRTPACSSSRAICWLSAGCVTCSRSAARPKCSSSATATNGRRSRGSTLMHGAYESGAIAISGRAPALAASSAVRRLLLVLLVIGGCGGDPEPAPPAPPPQPQPVGVPDGGTRAGHVGDQVTVPPADRSAPTAILELDPELAAPVLRATVTGRDPQGMARIRLSVEATITCAGERIPLTRYDPPPEVARPRIPPGRRAPTELRRVARVDLARGRCPRADVERVEGRAWADATSAHETEASSDPQTFAFR